MIETLTSSFLLLLKAEPLCWEGAAGKFTFKSSIPEFWFLFVEDAPRIVTSSELGITSKTIKHTSDRPHLPKDLFPLHSLISEKHNKIIQIPSRHWLMSRVDLTVEINVGVLASLALHDFFLGVCVKLAAVLTIM